MKTKNLKLRKLLDNDIKIVEKLLKKDYVEDLKLIEDIKKRLEKINFS